MADAPPNPDPRFPNRRPAAAVVGGQRRRGRRPPGGVPRAHPSPTFDSILSTATSAATAQTDQQSAVATRDPRHLEAPRLPSMNFYPPVSGIPADYRPDTAPGLIGSASDDVLRTPTSTASTSTTEGKKKQSMFSSFKSHGQDRPSASQAMLTPTSPLPPAISGKTARMLGLPKSIATVNEPLGDHSQSDDDDEEEVTEMDIEPDPPRSKKFSWGKAGKMFDSLTSKRHRSQTDTKDELAAASSSLYQFKEATDNVFSDDPIPPEPPRPAHEAPSRRSRKNKKNRKGVQEMSPIVESSHDELRSPYQHSESVPDLGTIPEYRGLSKSMPPLPHQNIHGPRYKLDDHDLSPSNNLTLGSSGIGGPSTRNRGRITRDQVGRPPRSTIPVRGPLQTLENEYLLYTEETLEEYKKKAAEWEAARKQTDEQVRALKVKHEKMKEEFAAMLKARDEEGKGKAEAEEEEEEDDDDLVSLRSSIDLSEEPTVHTAVAMPILKVTPGMVKLVDIPARKK